MPKFYFHLEEPSGPPDLVGQELEGIQAAKCFAFRMVADTLCGDAQAFWEAESHRVRVSDEFGLTLFVLDIQTTTSPAAKNAGRNKGEGGAL